ncbi:YSIRK signal domain/LPXTG anchor domain surface protein [Streptococcus sanguinis]|uniref:Cell wall surface anchor family protein n=1 Tax=Streptococcus sanguinis SK330 TaxID=888813 RepID=F2C6A4_STRSA|nr:YSIRK signal domain/LPXTG anchor domain surface protein [Streptococcus sanguinis]EGF15561.1 cell wall surface anchor family protein [Streptococcus sanguinis SK330]
MKFNSNQKYTRWSIRRLSVGVASVVVASGFFLLVGQPNTVHADDLTSTPTKVLQEDSSLLENNKLPETALKEEMDSALPANQSAPKEEVDETISLDKSSLAPKEEMVKPKKEQTMAEVSNQKEEAKPEATLVEVSNQDREATTSQSVTTPDEVRKGVEENTKDSVDVPASYLEKANVPGPFLAGVNQVIPYEAFGGDGMLTRLLLKSSDKAPWSDNGKANNPALLPLEGLAKGQYFYEVDLNGNTTGKDGQALLDQLRINGTHAYQATVKVYGAKDGKPDSTNLVATKNVTVSLNGLVSKESVKDSVTKNIKDHIDVPASYLEKANVPGPFLAGVNQVIPYEAFGGDGMLTRLLLKSSDKAPWSDNGKANNPALLPLEGLAKGQYFYEVDLNGNTTGKDGQALLDQLRINGTHAYQATVKVYGAKDGKPDLTNLIATRQVIIRLYGKEMSAQPYQQEQMNVKPSTTDSMRTAKGMKEVDHRITDLKEKHPTSNPMADMVKKNDKPSLPKTGEAQTSTATIGFFGLALAGILGFLGLKERQKD